MVFFATIFCTKTSKNAMKHMILSACKIKGDVVSDQFMMLWFQKDSLNTVGFRTFRMFRVGDPGVLYKIVDFGRPK